MAIKVSCTCGKTISAKDEFAGRRVKCPACKEPLRIPKPKVEEESYDDEWDLDDYGEEEYEASPLPARRRRASSSNNASTKKRKKRSAKTDWR